jgi:hypothetical protein
MVRSNALLIFALALLASVLAGKALAQQPANSQLLFQPAVNQPPNATPLPPGGPALNAPGTAAANAAAANPIAANPGEPDPLPGLPRPADQPISLYLPPPAGAPYTCESVCHPYFENDPNLDPAPLPPPGWVWDVDFGILEPHVKNQLVDTVAVPGHSANTLSLPSAPLDWTASPRVELGYRLPSGFGEFAIAYQILASDGTGTVAGPDATAALKSEVEFNVVDFDYASRELSLWPGWGMKWRIGLRTADAYFSSLATEPFAAAAAGSGIFQSNVRNNFWGIGPHTTLELERRLGWEGWKLVGRVDGATLMGEVDQNFTEVSTTVGPGGHFVTGDIRRLQPMDAPMVKGFLGVGWNPQRLPNLTIESGFQYEYWWNVGRNDETASKADLDDKGICIRALFNY